MSGKKSKKFVVATEGATVDGRVIERSWIEQMAATYNPATYHAGVNLEHYRGTLPDGPFRNYGFVDALETRENDQKQLQLLATITPTPDLVDMTGKMQKVFTSIEVSPNFAKTGKAYLMGLAVTDTPASLGTEMLAFTAQNPQASPLTARKHDPANHFTAAAETVIEFEDVTTRPAKKPLLDVVRSLFSDKERQADKRFTDLEEAIEEVATHGATQSAETTAQFEVVDGKFAAIDAAHAEILARLAAIDQKFATTPAPQTQRPPADGGAKHLTDF